MKNKENREIPQRVLKTLELVRNSGMVNMFDRNGVLVVSEIYHKWSYVWLNLFCGKQSNRNKYSLVLEQFSNYLKDKQ